MQLNARLDNFNGNGNKIYQVVFVSPDEDTPAQEVNIEIWLANDESHLEDQMFEDYVVEGTWEEETFYEEIIPNMAFKQIGTVINITND